MGVSPPDPQQVTFTIWASALPCVEKATTRHRQHVLRVAEHQQHFTYGPWHLDFMIFTCQEISLFVWFFSATEKWNNHSYPMWHPEQVGGQLADHSPRVPSSDAGRTAEASGAFPRTHHSCRAVPIFTKSGYSILYPTEDNSTRSSTFSQVYLRRKCCAHLSLSPMENLTSVIINRR